MFGGTPIAPIVTAYRFGQVEDVIATRVNFRLNRITDEVVVIDMVIAGIVNLSRGA